jgi:hypothetical protein
MRVRRMFNYQERRINIRKKRKEEKRKKKKKVVSK